MAVRATMSDVISYTRELVSDAASSIFTDQKVQDALDQHRTHFDYILLDRDGDYRFYYSRAWRGDDVSLNRIPRSTHPIEVPDFAMYTQIGFLESGYDLRDGRTEENTAYTPDYANLIDGTYIFSTALDTDLYFFGDGYNTYRAAGDLLARTPDWGRLPMGSTSRGGISESYDWKDKVEMLYQRGYNLNRRARKLYRG
jgi:hypothetical protein